MEILAYSLALIIGFTMGLLGGGGSILAVPIFVYLLQIDEILATTYSLFVVGTVALLGSFRHYRNGHVDFKVAALFGLPTAVAGFLTKRYLVDLIPDVVFQTEAFTVNKNMFIMLLFALVMFLAAFAMIKGQRGLKLFPEDVKTPAWVLALIGIFIGALTSLIGAGGGFLIVPALVLLVHLPIHIAIGTSLLIISINSGSSFLGAMEHYANFNWTFLLLFTGIALMGVFIGSGVGQKISPFKLKRAFGWFVLVMAIVILTKEIIS